MKDKSKVKRARGKGDVKEQFLIRSRLKDHQNNFVRITTIPVSVPRLKGSPVINFDLYYKLKIIN